MLCYLLHTEANSNASSFSSCVQDEMSKTGRLNTVATLQVHVLYKVDGT